LGWLFDDVTTYLIITKGYSILETNPIFIKFGLIPFLAFSIVLPFIITLVWLFVIRTYKKLYRHRKYKLYDVFVFFCCVFIVWMTFNKILLGWDNINFLIDDLDDEKNEIIKENVAKLEEFKQTQPEEYQRQTSMHYKLSFSNINFLEMVFITLSAYILFRIGHKVRPNNVY